MTSLYYCHSFLSFPVSPFSYDLFFSSASTKVKAVIIKEQGKAALADIKEQSMWPGYIKVKTVDVACNPSMNDCLVKFESRVC
jgi:hypothetical protein